MSTRPRQSHQPGPLPNFGNDAMGSLLPENTKTAAPNISRLGYDIKREESTALRALKSGKAIHETRTAHRLGSMWDGHPVRMP